MIVKNYSKERVKQMETLPKVFSYNEGELFLTNADTVIKRLRNICGNYFANKLYTIHSLIYKKDLINMEELIVPSNLVSVSRTVVGYEMPYVHGITLYEYLNDKKVDLKDKIEALKKIGAVLRKMAERRKINELSDFFLNDLHEKNFMITQDGNIKVVDLDSCSISHNLKFGSKYVSSMTPIKDFAKYQIVKENSCGAEFIPSEDTDLYCYIIMILNFLSERRMHLYSYEEFMNYLNYLDMLGANKEFLIAVSRIYSEEKNINIDYLLDSIEELYGKTRNRNR